MLDNVMYSWKIYSDIVIIAEIIFIIHFVMTKTMKFTTTTTTKSFLGSERYREQSC